MTDLAERYGTAPRRGVNAVLALAALAGVVLVAVTVWSFAVEASPQVRSTLTRYEVLSQHEVVADVVVVRDSPDRTATCRLEAVALDHSVVGRLEQVVDSGPERQTLRVRFPTERRAVGVVLKGCTTEGQARPR